MHEYEEIAHKNAFISGTGKAAEMIRNHPWTKTTLGSPENWSLSLKTAVSMLLQVDSPMYLIWGKEQNRFCNDAFLHLLPHAGIGEDKTLENPGFKDFLEGKSIPAVHLSGFAFSLSAIFGENGQINGILAVPAKTAEKSKYETLFYELVTQAPVGIAILKGDDFVYAVANTKYLEIVDRPKRW